MIRKRLRMLSLLSAMLCCVAVSAQHKVEMIPFGNMDQWIDRQIKESGIIGGATKNVYAIGPTATIRENNRLFRKLLPHTTSMTKRKKQDKRESREQQESRRKNDI